MGHLCCTNCPSPSVTSSLRKICSLVRQERSTHCLGYIPGWLLERAVGTSGQLDWGLLMAEGA